MPNGLLVLELLVVLLLVLSFGFERSIIVFLLESFSRGQYLAFICLTCSHTNFGFEGSATVFHRESARGGSGEVKPPRKHGDLGARQAPQLSRNSVSQLSTIATVHACTIAACTIAIAHACTVAIAHACTIAIHANIPR